MTMTLGQYWDYERNRQIREGAMRDMTDIEASEYQHRAGATAVYPGAGTIQGLLYTALGLAGEAGEVANKVKKIIRDDGGVLTDERCAQIEKELGGVAWYLARAASELDTPLGEIMRDNLAILEARQEAGTIHGDGDNREG